VKIFEKIKDFFIPHHGNNYAPASLQKAAVLGMMLLVVISFTVANLQALLWISSDWMVSTILPAVVVQETNEEREDGNLVALRRNATLDEAAQLKANDMAEHSYFSHNSPSGVTPWYWFGVADYNYVHAGENLAVHFTDSGEVVEAWMDSPTHRANIMNGNYQEIGIGTAKGTYEGFDTVFVVQLFGTPAAPAPSRTVTEDTPVTVAAVEETVPTVSTTSSTALALATALTLPEVEEASPILEDETNNEPVVAGAGVDEVAQEEEVNETEEVASSSSVTTPAIITPSTEVANTREVAVTESGTVVYSSYVSTSTGGIPASIESVATGSNSGGIGGTTLPILSIVTKPQLVLEFAYMIIGAFVLLSLIISIVIEIRRQHPLQIAYSAGLVALMFLLFNLHLSLTGGALIM